MAVGMVTATAIAKELSQAESRLDVNPESDGGCHQRDREGHRHGRDRGSQQRGVFGVEVVASLSGSSTRAVVHQLRSLEAWRSARARVMCAVT